jgi:low affinity Fe/Cu permease
MDRGAQAQTRRRGRLGDAFYRMAHAAAATFGTPWAFAGALLLVIVWALVGPLFHFSESWQLVINTGTTIITFLMVFLIQATQNRDARALHLKLDELIRASAARDVFADLEDATDAELDAFQREFEQLRKQGMHAPQAVRHAQRKLERKSTSAAAQARTRSR